MTPIISDGFGRPKTALRVSYSRPGLPTQLTRIVEKILLSFKELRSSRHRVKVLADIGKCVNDKDDKC